MIVDFVLLKSVLLYYEYDAPQALSYTPSHLLALRYRTPTPDVPFPRGGAGHNDEFVVYVGVLCCRRVTDRDGARACAVYHHCCELTFNCRFHKSRSSPLRDWGLFLGEGAKLCGMWIVFRHNWKGVCAPLQNISRHCA